MKRTLERVEIRAPVAASSVNRSLLRGWLFTSDKVSTESCTLKSKFDAFVAVLPGHHGGKSVFKMAVGCDVIITLVVTLW